MLSSAEEVRFREKYSPVTESGCWLWEAATNGSGYGQFAVKRKPRLAHRVAWELYNGSIEEGKFVCHKCDVPCCVNPDHLFLGTQKENLQDMSTKGRGRGGRRKKITDEDLAIIVTYNKEDYKEAAIEIGISAPYAWRILNGKIPGYTTKIKEILNHD